MATRTRASRETPRAIPLAKATEQRARLASAQADLAELKAAEKTPSSRRVVAIGKAA
jgi:phage terminase Nu1 subunit (DNA packaging protein)